MGAVGADRHRVALAQLVDMLRSSHQIVPGNVAGFEMKALMRPTTFRFEPGTIDICQAQGGTVVDRRLALCQHQLAAAFQFLARLVAGIEPALSDQAVARQS